MLRSYDHSSIHMHNPLTLNVSCLRCSERLICNTYIDQELTFILEKVSQLLIRINIEHYISIVLDMFTFMDNIKCNSLKMTIIKLHVYTQQSFICKPLIDKYGVNLTQKYYKSYQVI